MIEWDQLVLILVGVTVGGMFGTEYANWRLGRRIGKYIKATKNLLEGLTGVKLDVFMALSPENQRKMLSVKAQELWTSLFPDLTMPAPPPSRLTSLNETKYYMPMCPKCHFAASPVRAEVGSWVSASCPTHGNYKVKVPAQGDHETEYQIEEKETK